MILYASQSLRVAMVPDNAKYVGRDIQLDRTPMRRVDETWLAFLRANHTGTAGDAEEFRRHLEEWCPALSKSNATIPEGYRPPVKFEFTWQ